MRQFYYTLILLIFLTSCGNSQTTNSQAPLTGILKNDLKTLLPIGKFNADIMDGVKQNPRQLELAKRLQIAVKQNYNWFLEYMKTVPEGEPIPYNSKLGLTKEEYTELLGFIDNIETVSTGTQEISIKLKNDVINFKSSNKLSNLNSLTIDLKGNTAIFGQYKMKFSDTLNVKTDKNGLKSKWRGYSWRFEEPKNLDLESLKDLKNVKLKQYKLTIGRLEKNGKTYISLKGREVEGGARTVDFDVPIMF